MSFCPRLPFLWPFLDNKFLPSKFRGHLSLYTSIWRTFSSSSWNSTNSLLPHAGHPDLTLRRTSFRDLRLNPYPLINKNPKYLEIRNVIETFRTFEHGARGIEEITVRGRIFSVRKASSKLVFYDIHQQGSKIQIVCSAKSYTPKSPSFTEITRVLHRGDFIEITGLPGKTNTGELSIFANSSILLSPCLHAIPESLKDPEKRFSNRHVDFLVNPQSVNNILVRSLAVNHIRRYLLQKGFVEVDTPILDECSGGAIATPFETKSRALGEFPLFLRISPELWLKRLVIGGFDKVFEIGKSFRNEGIPYLSLFKQVGIDASHNPEFTTCEFYQSFAGLDDLMEITQELLLGITNSVNESGILKSCLELKSPFNRMDFVPALEKAMNRRLPDLNSPDLNKELVSLFQVLDVPLPSQPTSPRLLDKLSQKYLEPQCQQPTFIYNIPMILSPLAKSDNSVARRFELFIQGQELCNAYEEENDPLQQRHKFLLQQQDREEYIPESQSLDESFISALEWGLPPTAGWGLGIDRLCMLITGQGRINEVLPFGGLKQSVRQSDRQSRA